MKQNLFGIFSLKNLDLFKSILLILMLLQGNVAEIYPLVAEPASSEPYHKDTNMELLNYCVAKYEIIRLLKRDERGVTALEYGLIAAFIAVVIIGSITALGDNLSGVFYRISNEVSRGR